MNDKTPRQILAKKIMSEPGPAGKAVAEAVDTVGAEYGSDMGEAALESATGVLKVLRTLNVAGIPVNITHTVPTGSQVPEKFLGPEAIGTILADEKIIEPEHVTLFNLRSL